MLIQVLAELIIISKENMKIILQLCLVISCSFIDNACRCSNNHYTLAQHAENADIVIVGYILTEKIVGRKNVYEVSVAEVFKGSIERKTITVSTDNATSCHFTLSPQTKYFLFATEYNKEYYTGNCTGTQVFSETKISELACVEHKK